jgi:hypothetical protein
MEGVGGTREEPSVWELAYLSQLFFWPVTLFDVVVSSGFRIRDGRDRSMSLSASSSVC